LFNIDQLVKGAPQLTGDTFALIHTLGQCGNSSLLGNLKDRVLVDEESPAA